MIVDREEYPASGVGGLEQIEEFHVELNRIKGAEVGRVEQLNRSVPLAPRVLHLVVFVRSRTVSLLKG